MEYFFLDNKTEPVYPQVQCTTLEHAHRFKSNAFPDFEPQLKFRLEPNAKLTDFLSEASISANGFLLSNRARQLLDQFSLSAHRYFPVTVADCSIQYYWLQFVSNPSNLDWIDFSQSQFYVKKGLKNMGAIALSSSEDFLLKKSELDYLSKISDKSLRFSNQFHPDLDLFMLPLVNAKKYISQKLKVVLVNERITGIEILQSNIF